MFKIRTLNNISTIGLQRLLAVDYSVGDDIAYTLMDVDRVLPPALMAEIAAIPGVLATHALTDVMPS